MIRMRTLLLLATLTALFVWAGHALGGQAGLVFALALAGLMTLGGCGFSEKAVVRVYDLREISPGRRGRSAKQPRTGWQA